jgi:hypothetical protein
MRTQTSKNIVVTLIGNTTEISTATLNQGAWTTLYILQKQDCLFLESIALRLSILMGHNVTLDGRVNQTGSTEV